MDDFHSDLLNGWDKQNEDLEDVYDNTYSGFYTAHQSSLGHYFRNIYQILRLINSNKSHTKDEKKIYSNILRAQLSTYELGLLLLNCLSDFGKDKHKPLIEKYSLFEHLPILEEIPSKLYTKYDRKAYETTNKEVLKLYES